MKTVRGMQDFIGFRAKKKLFVQETCRQVFELFCFEPLESPALEELGTLAKKDSAGQAILDEIYFFKDKSQREIGLRFDLTVPLARVIASNSGLKKPFKRYQIAPVWRYDKPQAKRFREFTQADADVVGSASILADLECLLIAVEIFSRLDLNAKIRVNNRVLLEDFAIACGVKKEQAKECFRCLDKLDKIDKSVVAKELREKKIGTKILESLSCSIPDLQKIIPASKGLKELNELFELAAQAGIEKFLEFDLSLARGLEYYTGNVFEVIVNGPSAGGGGRYDNLIADFGGLSTPAVGISFGIERLMELVEDKIVQKNNKRFLIAAVSEQFQKNALFLVQQIRKLGFECEMDLMQRNPSKNLEFANSKGIGFVVFFGENEAKEKAFKAKNLKTGQETKINLANLQELKKLI